MPTITSLIRQSCSLRYQTFPTNRPSLAIVNKPDSTGPERDLPRATSGRSSIFTTWSGLMKRRHDGERRERNDLHSWPFTARASAVENSGSDSAADHRATAE